MLTQALKRLDLAVRRELAIDDFGNNDAAFSEGANHSVEQQPGPVAFERVHGDANPKVAFLGSANVFWEEDDALRR